MANGKYRRVSRRAQLLANFQMTDAQWDDLLIPINMAFFFNSSVEGRTIPLYPSPAGAVESLLPLDAWSEIVEENPVLSQLRPDIEALLVNRVGHAHDLSEAEYYIAPIDECYRLVGLIRDQLEGAFRRLRGLGGNWAILFRVKIARGHSQWRSSCLI